MKFKDPTLVDSRLKDHKAYVPAPLKIGSIPAWLKKKLRAYAKKSGDYEASSWCPLQELWEIGRESGSGGMWIDHYGSVKYGCREAFCSEPYGLAKEDLQAILNLCESIDVDAFIDAGSEHYPTRTLRVTISENRSET